MGGRLGRALGLMGLFRCWALLERGGGMLKSRGGRLLLGRHRC